MAPKHFSGIEDERWNIKTKDASFALLTQEIPRFLGVLSQKLDKV